MSMGKRAYNILRGYVSSEWERIRGVEQELAEKELATRPETPAQKSSPQPSAPISSSPATPEQQKAYARRLLGLTETCTFSEVRKAYARLNKRSDPANFPASSPEANQAVEIHRKVNWAYTVLTEDMDDTERRFRTLELE